MFMDKKGEYQDFPSKVFCLTLLTNFVVEPFSVKFLSGIEKLYALEGYVTTSVEVFCLTVPKIYIGNPSMLCFRKLAVAKKFMEKREGQKSRFSIDKFLSHSTETFRRGTLLCCVSELFR